MFEELLEFKQEIETNKQNVAMLLVVHLNDEVKEIRESVERIIKRWWKVIGRENLEEELKGKTFGWISVDKLFDFSGFVL